ncbi:MAG TPA: hypothetical protein PKE00_04415, partial [Planctomycetota bacterium]|nr:hypothetical protein [Planctomycetota bacterium]
YLFPWGDTAFDQLRANTGRVGLWRRTRVGTFESGRNLGREDSCYDLIGNVAEWTMTPGAVVRLEGPWRGEAPPDDVADRAEAFPLLDAVWPVGLPLPCGPASPWIAEIAAADIAVAAASVRRVDYCTIGFSCGEYLPAGASRLRWAERLGLAYRQPGERRWDLGFRMATDPNCFLAGLERAEGSPTEAEAAELRRFLRTELEAFRSAARLRLRRLAPASLGLEATTIGGWAQLAYEVLAVSAR